LKKTLIIDNYDSFTYNLYQYIAEIGGNPVVFKNDQLTLNEIRKIAPSHIILSPGPGTVEKKEDFGICREILENIISKNKKGSWEKVEGGLPWSEAAAPPTHIPILGVCLGHQGIIHAFGGKIMPAPHIMHGKQSLIEHDNSILFKNVKNPFLAMRYHSLCGSKENFPTALKITAWSKEDQTIMAIEHLTYPLFGVQFHPESFGTEAGKQILKNFLSAATINKKS